MPDLHTTVRVVLLFMFLDSPTQELDVSFRVKHKDGHDMVYANSGNMKHQRADSTGAAPPSATPGEGTSAQGEQEKNRKDKMQVPPDIDETVSP